MMGRASLKARVQCVSTSLSYYTGVDGVSVKRQQNNALSGALLMDVGQNEAETCSIAV